VREFTDKTNQRWEIELTIGLVSRLRKNTRFNLYEPHAGTPPLVQVLDDDLEAFWELLWHLVEKQADARSINAEKFGELMAARSLIDAQRVFMEEWRDFCHGLQQPQHAAMLESLIKHNAMILEAVTLKSREQFAIVDQMSEKAIQTALNEKFGKEQGSFASTLEASLGDNSTTCSTGADAQTVKA